MEVVIYYYNIYICIYNYTYIPGIYNIAFLSVLLGDYLFFSLAVMAVSYNNLYLYIYIYIYSHKCAYSQACKPQFLTCSNCFGKPTPIVWRNYYLCKSSGYIHILQWPMLWIVLYHFIHPESCEQHTCKTGVNPEWRTQHTCKTGVKP